MSRRTHRESVAEGVDASLRFDEFRGDLYRYLRRKLKDGSRAEDLTQEVYLRLARIMDRQLIQNPQAYVFGVAFNVLYEFRLHEARSPVTFDSKTVDVLGEYLPAEGESPDEIQEQSARLQWLDGVLNNLSPMQRAVLLMAKRQGLAHAQIAEKLGISIGTVRKHLARAIGHCRQAMPQGALP